MTVSTEKPHAGRDHAVLLVGAGSVMLVDDVDPADWGAVEPGRAER